MKKIPQIETESDNNEIIDINNISYLYIWFYDVYLTYSNNHVNIYINIIFKGGEWSEEKNSFSKSYCFSGWIYYSGNCH